MMDLAPGKAQLYDRLRYDVVAAGGQMLLLSNTYEWPQVFSVTLDDASARIRVYLWHLTHDTARDDYKFQLTGVSGNRFIFETGVRTIILGYYDAMRVYLAADSTHRTDSLRHLSSNSSTAEAFGERKSERILCVHKNANQRKCCRCTTRFHRHLFNAGRIDPRRRRTPRRCCSTKWSHCCRWRA